MSDSFDDAVYSALTGRHYAFTADELVVAIGNEPAVVDAALASLVASGKAVRLDDGTFLSDVAAKRLDNTARRAVTAFHRKFPLLPGMPAKDLEAVLPKAAEYRSLASVVRRFAANGVFVTETRDRIRLPEHTVEMPEGWRAAADEMLAVYATAGLQPPSSYNFQANYPRHINVRAILAILTETGALVPLEDEIFIDAATYLRVKQTVREIASRSGGEITVGAVRDALQSTRKFVLPLLELLDAEGFTRRDGDIHFLA